MVRQPSCNCTWNRRSARSYPCCWSKRIVWFSCRICWRIRRSISGRCISWIRREWSWWRIRVTSRRRLLCWARIAVVRMWRIMGIWPNLMVTGWRRYLIGLSFIFRIRPSGYHSYSGLLKLIKNNVSIRKSHNNFSPSCCKLPNNFGNSITVYR